MYYFIITITNSVFSILLFLNSLHYLQGLDQNGVIFVHPFMGYHGHYLLTQQPSRSEDHMMKPPRAVLPGVPHCRDHGHHMTAPVEDSYYQFQSHQDLKFTDEDWRKASSSPGVISDVPSEAPPLDPNLTCPHCGRQFRKGDIQNFRLHANTCH